MPHTHWDREWYLARSRFHARLVAMMDDLLAHLDARDLPTFVLDGQTILVEDYLRVRPDREARLRRLAQRRQLQLGPWYVLADELIPSGESLIHNLLAGAADCARLGGRMPVLYSPDAFGHPAVLPQLAREFGLRGAVLWRGLAGANGRADERRDLYDWVAPDRSRLPVYHLPPDGYEVGAALPADRARLVKVWPALREQLVRRASSPHVAVPVGADHHAARSDLDALRRALASIERGHRVVVSTVDDFLAAATESSVRAEIRGELRWSYGYTWTLQGTHATRAPLKRHHARAELALERIASPLVALAARHRGADQGALLRTAWRTLLECQFHDTLCGCAVDDVARDAEARLGAVDGYARELVRASLHAVVHHDPDRARDAGAAPSPALAVWNPAARRRGGVILCDLTWFRRDVLVGPPSGRAPRRGAGAPPSFALRAENGRPVDVQVLSRARALERLDAARHYPDLDEVDALRVAVRVPPLPGLGVTALRSSDARGRAATRRSSGRVAVRGRTIRNRHLQVTVDTSGHLTIVHRRTGERYTGLVALEAGGDVGDTYTYCPPERDRIARSRGRAQIRRTASGPLAGSLEARWRFATGRGPVQVVLGVTLLDDEPFVRCTLTLDNAARDCRLRARFPVGLAGEPARAGAAFGFETRHPVAVRAQDFPAERPVATAPAQRWMGAARGRRGLGLLAPGFFEYEWTADGDLLLTLLRCVGQLSRGDLRTRPGHAGWAQPTPLAQCPGRDVVEFALAPVTARAASPAHFAALWEDAFLPLEATWLRDATTLSPAATGIELEGEGLVFSTAKPPERGAGLVLRCWNSRDEPVRGAWRLATPAREAALLHADERRTARLALRDRGRRIELVAPPRGIVTTRIR